MASTFPPQQQLMPTALAGLSAAQFARLRADLDAVRVQTDARLGQLDAERQLLLARKQKLDAALQRFNHSDALDALHSALQKAERLKTAAVAVKTPGKTPAKTPVGKPAKKRG